MWSLCIKLDNLVPLIIRRVLAVLLGSLEMCFSGVFYGMNAIFPIFQGIGIYGEVCQNLTTRCTEQIVIYANAFTTCCVVQVLLGVVIGLLIDNVGLRLINMVSSIINFTGLMMFTFLTPSSAVIIFIGSTLSGIGGTGMVMCTFSAGQLFSKTSSIVLTFIEGVYDTSSGMFAFVYLSHKTGFVFRNSFAILAVGALITGVLNSLFVQSYWLADMPKYKDVATEKTLISDDESEIKNRSIYKDNNQECPLDIRVDAALTEIFPSSKRSLQSLSFLVVVIFYCLGLLQFNFYLGEFSIVVDHYFKNPETSARLSSTFTFVLLGGIPTAFLCGAVVDKLRSVYKPNLEHLLTLPATYERNRAVMWFNLRPAAISMYIFAVLTVIVTCFQFIALEATFYANFIFFLLMRGFLFTTFSITVFSAFPVSQFGTIFGLTTTIAGCFSLIQYALILPAPNIANSIALVLALLLFIPPSIVFIASSNALNLLPNKDFEQEEIEV